MAFYFQFIDQDNKENLLPDVSKEISEWYEEHRDGGLPVDYAVGIVAEWGMVISMQTDDGQVTEEVIKRYAEDRPETKVDTELLIEFLAKRYTFKCWYGR